MATGWILLESLFPIKTGLLLAGLATLILFCQPAVREGVSSSVRFLSNAIAEAHPGKDEVTQDEIEDIRKVGDDRMQGEFDRDSSVQTWAEPTTSQVTGVKDASWHHLPLSDSTAQPCPGDEDEQVEELMQAGEDLLRKIDSRCGTEPAWSKLATSRTLLAEICERWKSEQLACKRTSTDFDIASLLNAFVDQVRQAIHFAALRDSASIADGRGFIGVKARIRVAWRQHLAEQQLQVEDL